MDNLKVLADATGWTRESYVSVDWSLVEQQLGTPLPDDYKSLHAMFPPGSFLNPDFESIEVQPPYLVDGAPDYLYQFRVEMTELSNWKAGQPEDVPCPIYPEPLGVIPWARSGRPCLFWERKSTNPAEWTVLVSNGGIWRRDGEPVIESFDCGAVDFLVGFVTGEISSRILDPDGGDTASSRRSPGFRPLPEHDWAEMSQVETPKLTRFSLRERKPR